MANKYANTCKPEGTPIAIVPNAECVDWCEGEADLDTCQPVDDIDSMNDYYKEKTQKWKLLDKQLDNYVKIETMCEAVEEVADKLGVELDDECEGLDLDEDSVTGLICPTKRFEEIFEEEGEAKCFRVLEWVKNNDATFVPNGLVASWNDDGNQI